MISLRQAFTALVVLILVVAFRYAEPIQDGDLFWHMAYAKQMLASGTLIPDHTLYSWTPAKTSMIYCAWAAELALYAIHAATGFTGLFVFRYAVVIAMLALAFSYARKAQAERQAATWLVLLILTLASYTGTILKPEIFSLLLLNVLVYSFFRYRLSGNPRWLYAAPAILLVWANSHGAFILAAPFLIATGIGEWLRGTERRTYRHLLIAWGLCGVAVMLTPYGPRYPMQLIADYLLQGTERPDAIMNSAHQSIFAPTARGMHLDELLLLMLALSGIALFRCWRTTRRIDWTILLLHLVYVPLFLTILRATFLFPAVFAYSVLYLRVDFMPRLPRWVPQAALATLFLLIAGRAIFEARNRPHWGSWLGFGIGYTNPMPEAEFLAAHSFPQQIYNNFDSGGYLLWRLYPRYRVMLDSRSFPYLAWFDERHNFERGEQMEEFLKRRPADVAVIDMGHQKAWMHFLTSREWRPVFYGPTAAVFLKRTVSFDEPLRSEVGEIRSAMAASFVFDFATAAGDYPAAWAVLRQVETRLSHQLTGGSLKAAESYRDAHRALRNGDWLQARALFNIAFRRRPVGERDRLIRIFLDNIAALREQGKDAETATYQAALRKLAAPE